MGNTESENKLPIETYEEVFITRSGKYITGAPHFKCYEDYKKWKKAKIEEGFNQLQDTPEH